MEQLGVVILAAGLGKRMRSAQAKVLHRLAGKPLLSHVIDATQGVYPDRLVVVVGHQAAEVQRACRQLHHVRQQLRRADRALERL